VKRFLASAALLALALSGATLSPAVAAEAVQDDESKALDSTATQWSFQLAYQWMDYKDDLLSNGQMRPAGLDNYLQLRIVAPVPLESLTILPRVTIRHYENLNTGATGLGNTEIFALMIPKSWDWGTGRVGIGPLITLPGSKKVAKDEFGYGFAAAVVNSRGKWFYGLLLTQSWRGIDPSALPTGTSDANPLGIAPFLNYRLGSGWYIGNGDMVALWDWDSREFYLPLGVRVGKVLVREKGSWNFYGEYQTSVIYDDWPGAAFFNDTATTEIYTMPIGFGK
jgi:hypothetical protein